MFFLVDASPYYGEDLQFSYVAAHQPSSPYWQSLNSDALKLDGLVVSFAPARAPEERPPGPPPAIEEPAVSIDMLDEGVDESGKWYQKLRFTVKPAGTLAEISEAIYGDATHVDELLELAKQQNPHVQRPQQLRIGDSIDVTVDPSATFVVKERQWDEAEGRLTQLFFNGGKEITYPNVKGGTLRLVDFPDDSRTKSFTFKSDDDIVTVNPGSRLAEYAYRPGDTFDGVVRLIYGQISATAMQDFIVNTQWTPDRWPPPTSEPKRLVFSTLAKWEDTKPVSSGFPESQIVTNDQYRALMRRRADAGIYPLVRQGTGTSYRVEIVDPTLTARDISQIIYGSPDQYLALVNLAGIQITPDATGKVPESFNPPLLGRRFDVFVDYLDEKFLLEPPISDSQAHRMVTRLTNGTVIEEYDASFRREDGMQSAIYYPSGYKKLIFRPGEATIAGLDFAFFVINGLKNDAKSDVDQRRSQEFIASFLWNWAPGVPREAGDNPESYRVYEASDGRNVEIVIGPKTSDSPVPLVLYRIWLANPFLGALAVVFLATVLVVATGTVLRRRA